MSSRTHFSRVASTSRTNQIRAARRRHLWAGVEQLEDRSLMAAFTPGNLVIYRVGSTGTPLVNTGSPVFLDEYTPTGTLVQSVAMPTTANLPQEQLVASGVASAEGFL